MSKSTTFTAAEVKKIKARLNKIQKFIDTKGAYGYYLFHGDDIKLVSKNNDQSVAKQQFLDKINGKSKYIGDTVYEVILDVYEEIAGIEQKLSGGPVRVGIIEYKITNNYDVEYILGYRDGAVWYTNQDILDGLFHAADLKPLFKKIHDNRIVVVNLGKVRAVNILNKY